VGFLFKIVIFAQKSNKIYSIMVIKQVFLDEKGRKELKKGIDQISDAVASTLGPCGQTVLLESENHIGGVTVTKDGVTVAKSINLYNPVQNLAVQLVREAASKTAISAGDGTTTSIVLTRAIMDSYDALSDNKFNKTQVLRSINKVCDELIERLDKMSKPVSGKMLLDVATISANNDPVIGKLISDVYSEVNHVTVENSKTTKTYSEVIKGIRVNRGWSSKYFINDHKKSECVFEDAYVLMTDQEISNLSNIEVIIKHVLSENKPLLIIGELSPQVLATLNMNVVQGKIKVCNIIPPNFGYRKSDMMTDIAIALGAHYYSEGTGDNLALCSVEGLGRVKKVIVGQDQTIIIPETDDNEALAHHIKELEASKELETLDANIDFTNERIANISGGVGVIYVGANSDIEQKELRDRVDDAVLAVKAAIEEGILPGGGIGLIDAMRYVKPGKNNDDDMARSIMNSAIGAPFKTICENAGLNWFECAEPIIDNRKNGFGLDVKNEKYGDMIKMGIIDPAKVTKTALKNAVSVATTILSTNAIITNVRENESVE
jgi:chaperonin GroEL